MTGIYFDTIRCLAAQGNAFGRTGILDKYGNIFGIILVVFGIIMLCFSLKVRRMGSFYLEMENHDPVIKDNGFEIGKAMVGQTRSIEIAGKNFTEVQLLFELDGETYEKWTPDLGIQGFVNIEYDPDDPENFYITDTLETEQSADVDEDGVALEDQGKPANIAFVVMLVFAIVLLGLGSGFLYDFYMVK